MGVNVGNTSNTSSISRMGGLIGTGVGIITSAALLVTGLSSNSEKSKIEQLYASAKKEVVVVTDSVNVGSEWIKQNKTDTLYTVSAAKMIELGLPVPK